MYRHICVPVDNSEHSHRAADLGVVLACTLGARLTGVHVYAGRLHDARFRQMEYTLPERYREEGELTRQREVHDSLIRMGLRLISESYLDAMARRAEAAGLTLERKTFDGKHHRALLEDARRSDYDLVVMGALGMGAVKDSLLGSVTERFVRGTATDTLVVRDLDAAGGRSAAIVVGLDGSAQSFHALRVGLALGRAVGRPVEAVAVYDPYLHYALFKSIVGVLSAQAARVFRFAEQERLHEEIIDSGLARIYQSHLDLGRRLAEAEGVPLTTALLAGKCFEKVLQHCRATQPWLLVLGRAGAHSDADERELGSNSENLLRLAPGNVLLTAGRFTPPTDLLAEETVTWTAQAEARMDRVPAPVKGVARAAVLRHAVERGHTVITSDVIDEVMALVMPGRGPERLRAVALEAATAAIRAAGPVRTAICGGCGHAARGDGPVARCPVCGAPADRFAVIDGAALEAAAQRQGGTRVEEALPGIALRWAADALAALDGIADAVLRRRTRDRIEKHALARRLPVITREAAAPFIGEAAGGATAPAAVGAPARSVAWAPEAEGRLARVPAGFMRDMTRQEVEKRAHAAGLAEVDLARCEAWLAEIRATMCRAREKREGPGA